MALAGVEGTLDGDCGDLLIGRDVTGAAFRGIAGSNQIVSEPLRFGASVSLGQFRVLQVGGLLVTTGSHAGFAR